MGYDRLWEHLDQFLKLDFADLSFVIITTWRVQGFGVIVRLDIRVEEELDSSGSGMGDLTFEQGNHRQGQEEDD